MSAPNVDQINWQDKFYEHLKTMPLAGEGRGFNDQALPKAARLAKLAGLSEEEAAQAILKTQDGAKRDVDGEVQSTVERIYADDSEHREKNPKWPEPEKRLIDDILAKPELAKPDSNQPGLDQRPTMEFLKFLFDGDPLVTVGEKFILENGKEVIPGHTMLLSKLPEMSRTFEFVVPSAAIKREHQGKGDERPSKHCQEMYPKRHYLVIEFDSTPKPEAKRILHHLASFAPLVMIVDSAGKSLHGWFCCSRADEACVDRFFKYAMRVGGDPKMHSIMQFARMPNSIRSNNKAKQPVIFWQPEAKGREWKLDALPDELRVYSILEIPEEENPEASNLLGDRFLSRGKAMQFVGPTGVGKSTLVVQAGLLWAAGRDLFGLQPTKSLRVLYVQAENDDQDVSAMVGGIMDGVKFSQAERELIGKNMLYCRLNDYGADVLTKIDQIAQRHKLDLLVLDPLFAYMTGSVTDQSTVSEFLRKRLQPFLERNDCGCVIIHHVNKPPTSKKDRVEWNGGDFAYAGSGSNELANFFKAILVVRNIGSRDVFELVVAKRHKKAGMVNHAGEKSDRIHIRHSPDPDLQYWEQCDPEEVEEAEAQGRTNYGDAFVEAARGTSGTVSKTEMANAAKVSPKTIERLFRGKEFVPVATSDGKRIRLSNKRGRITGCEVTDEGIKATVRKPRPENAQ